MFLSVRIAGSENVLLFYAEFRGLNVSSVTVSTNLNIITTSLGVVKPTIKLTPLDLKQRKINYALIHLSTPTIKEIIKQT